jgi:hypothetical protein
MISKVGLREFPTQELKKSSLPEGERSKALSLKKDECCGGDDCYISFKGAQTAPKAEEKKGGISGLSLALATLLGGVVGYLGRNKLVSSEEKLLKGLDTEDKLAALKKDITKQVVQMDEKGFASVKIPAYTKIAKTRRNNLVKRLEKLDIQDFGNKVNELTKEVAEMSKENLAKMQRTILEAKASKAKPMLLGAGILGLAYVAYAKLIKKD